MRCALHDDELLEAISESNLPDKVKSLLDQRLRFLFALEQELPVVRSERVLESERADLICRMFAEFLERQGVPHDSEACTPEVCACWQAPYRKVALQQ